MNTLPDDLHANEDYWQEYECPRCGMDFDVSPIPLHGAFIHCSGCGNEWPSHTGTFSTHVIGEDGFAEQAEICENGVAP